MKKTIFAVVAAIAAPSLLSAAEFVISGQDTKSVFIRATNRKSGRWFDHGAGKIMQRFGKIITGREVPVIYAAQLGDRNAYDFRIWVGRQPEVDRVIGKRLDALDDDGYIIHAEGRDLYVAGKHWWGSNWAAHDLLERFAGCRWYLDEPQWSRWRELGFVGPGDIIPKAKSVSLPGDTSIVEEPDYKSRWFRRTPYNSFRLRYRDKFHHALRHIVPPSKLFDQHPEYFPEIDGKRSRPKNDEQFQPCVSNPNVTDIVANYCITHFNENPTAGSVSIGMNDSGRFCECKPCLAAAPANFTDKNQRIAWGFFNFYNRVAEKVSSKHPNRRLGCLAYARLRLLPKDSIQLHPMIVPYYTVDSAQFFEPSLARERREGARAWNRVSRQMGVYEYMYGKGFVVPRIYNRYLAANIKNRYEGSADGFYSEAYPNWGLDGPKYWLVSKLLWDTSLDVDQLLNQFYGDMFGRSGDSLSPAAGAMKNYFDFLEETWCTQTLPGRSGNYRWYFDPKHIEIFPPEKCDTAWEHLLRAEQLTMDKDVRKRITYFKTAFQITRILSKRYVAAKHLNASFAEAPDNLAANLPLLSQWQQAGNLASAIEEARNLGFGILSDTGDHDMLDEAPKFDRQPVLPATSIAKALVDNSTSGRRFANHESVFRSVATKVGSNELVQDLTKRGIHYVRRTEQPPNIDGTINPSEWGQPDFDGRFFRYAHIAATSQSLLDSFAPERNRVWTRRHGDEIYFAFDLEQDPSTISATVTEGDTAKWRNPPMVNDDCIVLCFHARGWAMQSIRVNAIGTVTDYQNSGRVDLEITEAKTRRTKTGWQLEMKVNFKRLNIYPAAMKNLDERPEISIARYTRRPNPYKRGEFKVEATTLMPFAATGGSANGGTSPGNMYFRASSRVIVQP